MSKLNFLATRMRLLPRIFLCCLGLCLCLVTASENVTQSVPLSTSLPPSRGSREMYEEYDAPIGDRELLYDPYKPYAGDETAEKGIRKLDSSLESVEEAHNQTDGFPRASRSSSSDDEEEVVVFEDSEASNAKPNISGILVTQQIDDILKHNGRMMLPSSFEEREDAPQERNETRQDVVQKLGPRKVRAESITPSTISSAVYARNVSRLEEIFDLYNPYRLLDNWEISDELEKMTVKCREQSKLYFLALRRGESWAIKSKWALNW